MTLYIRSDNVVAMQDISLTDRQQQVLDFIREHIQGAGYPPTIREIGDHLGIASTNGVADHLKALRRKGALTHEGMKSRALKPTNLLRAAIGGESIAIPLLGRVAAGEPILAEENAEGTVVIDAMLVGKHKKLFALRVVGESMIEDGIFDGDFIFVQKRSHADPGDTVVVLIDNEATVKHYYPEGDRIRLQPANAAMKPIYIHKDSFRETQILGLVVGVYRQVVR